MNTTKEIAKRIVECCEGHDVPDINDSLDLAKAVIADDTRIGDLGPVFALINDRFKGHFYAGERLAPVLVRLLDALAFFEVRATQAAEDRERIMIAAVLSEREACAEIADAHDMPDGASLDTLDGYEVNRVAAAIRARGEAPR